MITLKTRLGHNIYDGSIILPPAPNIVSPTDISEPIAIPPEAHRQSDDDTGITIYKGGSIISSRLSNMDPQSLRRPGGYMKNFNFTISQSNTPVRIHVGKFDQLDPVSDTYIFLYRNIKLPETVIVSNDDNFDYYHITGQLGSTIITTLSQGYYILEVTSFAAGDTFDFKVQII